MAVLIKQGEVDFIAGEQHLNFYQKFLDGCKSAGLRTVNFDGGIGGSSVIVDGARDSVKWVECLFTTLSGSSDETRRALLPFGATFEGKMAGGQRNNVVSARDNGVSIGQNGMVVPGVAKGANTVEYSELRLDVGRGIEAECGLIRGPNYKKNKLKRERRRGKSRGAQNICLGKEQSIEFFKLQREKAQAEISCVYLEERKEQLRISKIFADQQAQKLAASQARLDQCKKSSIVGCERDELQESWTKRKIAENKIATLRAEQALQLWNGSSEFVEERRKFREMNADYKQSILGKKMEAMKAKTTVSVKQKQADDIGLNRKEFTGEDSKSTISSIPSVSPSSSVSQITSQSSVASGRSSEFQRAVEGLTKRQGVEVMALKRRGIGGHALTWQECRLRVIRASEDQSEYGLYNL